MRIVRDEVGSADFFVGEVAAATTGDKNFAAWLVVMFQDQDAAAALGGGDAAH